MGGIAGLSVTADAICGSGRHDLGGKSQQEHVKSLCMYVGRHGDVQFLDMQAIGLLPLVLHK